MMREEARAGFDFGAMRDAIERRDPEALIGFYAPDAELRVLNAANPDGATFRLGGRAEIERYLRVVCPQRAPCLIEEEVVDEGRVTFREVCEYPDGSRVSVETTLELREGRISRQLDVAGSSSHDHESPRPDPELTTQRATTD